MSEERNEITGAEQLKDRHERIVVLTHLLNLACSMVSAHVLCIHCFVPFVCFR